MSKITAGFDSPVHDAQQVFRELMEAMSRPGKRVSLDYSTQFGSASLAATQVLLTLADNATRLWLSPHFGTDKALIENIRFHCSSPLTELKSESVFALVRGSELEEFEGFNIGDEQYPDRSTTLIIEVDSLTEGDTLSFAGPGIQSTTEMKVKGLNPLLLLALVTKRSHFPHGVDILFTSGSDVIALPRSTAVTLETEEATCM
ncbi:phosphonate C-P lyase system protein PhnH [Enterovibrio norvegicus]|uniref:phosphonate C-P lyase system protein PhnH n=1 Tax=Enterovibrio norvegicus TaxID=188144 RepID=UPI0002F23320|nr:phosphonate C-P lyase system protein PhnH [Enterovibrio norvegicus]OEE65118.1 phosphonate C-P lyase system protein PhnH [Enterovibrio norvegicus]OEF48415.1 phosphonate C-P lyase system protein PhnH [Enterovibrio norvegicus]